MEDTEVLTLERLQEAIANLPKRKYPKRMKISYSDYRQLREACDCFGILPELSKNVSLGFGMEIVPSLEIADGTYEMEF